MRILTTEEEEMILSRDGAYDIVLSEDNTLRRMFLMVCDLISDFNLRKKEDSVSNDINTTFYYLGDM